MSGRWRAPVLLLALALASCMAGTQSVRPGTLMPGQLRVGVAQGLGRNLTDDFAFAAPTSEAKRNAHAVWLTELSAHYGLVRDLDVGVRLRPFGRGGRVELLYQLVRERSVGIGVALGLAADGFFQPETQLACAGGGCYSRSFAGVLGDVPLIISGYVTRRIALFGGGRYNHLLIVGRERYRSQDRSFRPLVIDKTVHQPLGGWFVGAEFEGLHLRVVPQLSGNLVWLPDESLTHVIHPSLEVAFVF